MEINPEKITGGEMELLHWQFGGNMSVYKTALWDAIACGDNINLGRLKAVYPEQIDAYLQYIGSPDYWTDLLIRAGLAKAPEPATPATPASDDGDQGPVAASVNTDKKPYDH